MAGVDRPRRAVAATVRLLTAAEDVYVRGCDRLADRLIAAIDRPDRDIDDPHRR